MSSGYSIRPARSLAEWETCFNAIEKPHLMQSMAYGEAKKLAQRWDVNRLVFEHGGTPVAICQVLEKRVAGLRVASRINRGPLFLDDTPSYSVKENVFRLLRSRWRYLVGGPLLIAPALDASEENTHILVQSGFTDRKESGWNSALIDLAPDESEIRKRLSSKWRNQLKASQACELQLRSSTSADSAAWILKLHEDHQKVKGFLGPGSAFLKALHKTRPNDFIVLQAVLDEEPVAGTAIIKFGRAAEYFVGWSSVAGRERSSGNFLLWNALLEMKAAGCRWLDVGGYSTSKKAGFTQFKKGMRGTEYQLIGEWLCY